MENRDVKSSAKRTFSFPVMIAIAAVLFLAGMTIHVPTALGQGITENAIISWQGVYEQQSQEYFLQVDYQGAPVDSYPMGTMPQAWFHPAQGDRLTTKIDDPRVMMFAYRANPGLVKTLLGTHDNVSAFFVVFPAGPVSYTDRFLHALSAQGINPDRFGGPDIPVGVVPYSRLTGGVLHIDTEVNDNTLTQCKPGAMPLELQALLAQH